ncbi:TomO hydrophobic C-terminal domain-containing protein [Wolbachia endosymbiont (group B) of Athalia cordata]|uniref:TomO hydrophobic C-terminal domain-containing protein n=1 Tax=Wolbachia endosymbiont (group B) of Athalia cordata TaxID=2953986 RepID=UPI002230F487|nr:leucine-rich repeat domain-containing protein [Wolbachia endosymbiont (group B) of Athalia cordata]
MDFSEYVKGNILDVYNEQVDINNLISFLQENKNITELSLTWCGIDKEGAKAFADVDLTNLTQLNLTGNNIGNEEAEALAKSNLTNLTTLDLSHNDIGNEGAKALAKSNLTNLTKLNLFDNKIGNEGAKAFAKSNLTNLTELDLANNSIDAEGVEAFAKSNLTKLTKLNLRHNKIGNKEAKALAESEKCCEFIGKIARIDNNGGTRALFELLKKSWSQARAKSKSNVCKLDESTVRSLFFDLARHGYHKEGIKVLLDDSDKYPFLINLRNEQGHTLSHVYDQDLQMQKFFFECGMIPEQRRDDLPNNYSFAEEDIKLFLQDLAKNLVQHAKLHSELKKALKDFAMCKVDIGDPEKITFEEQKILAEINKYFSENIKGILPNYDRIIPNKDEYKLIINGLSGVKEMKDFAQEPSNQQENITRETEAQIDENSDDKFFDAEDYNESRATIRESDTDEKSKDVNESIFLEENNTPLVLRRLHSETSVVATDQTNGIQNNNQQPSNLNNDATRSEKKSKLPIVAASTLAIAGVALGVAIAVYSGMLAVGIAVGVCCLIAAAIVSYYDRPSNSLENSNVEEFVTNEEHTIV